MKNNLLKSLLVLLTSMFASIAFSQSISGKVSDASGPLPGASVVVKGSSAGVQTDIDGNYTINNVDANATLVYSFIGLKSQEINVAGKKTINVTLQSDQQQLQEVVVIGYGSVKKKDATGAIDQLSSKKFDNVSATSPAEILRGKVAGVQVTSVSGEPGAGTAIRIRGTSSIRSGNGPLIVVDGVPLDGGDVSSGGNDIGLGSSSSRNPLNFINQNDIESMSILKDASSTAIYGSRGANGVIIITTKKGKVGKPELTYNSSVQFSSLSGDFDVMSANQFVANGGDDNGSRSYNWKDAILRNGITTNNDVSFSTSNENSSTRLSFGASNTEGIVKNTGIDKYTLSLSNSNDFFNNRLKVETRALYAGIKDKSTLITNNVGFIGNVVGSALYWNPTNPIYNTDGSYNVINDTYLNPVQLLNSYNDYTDTNKFLASVKSTFKITNNFNYQFLFGIETSNSIRKNELLPSINIQNVAQATDPNTSVTKYGQASILGQNKFSRTFEHTLNYNKKISDNFEFDVLGGFSYYDYNTNSSLATGKGFSPDQTNLIDNIEGGLQNEYRVASGKESNELQSFFGRFNMTIYKKLLLTGTFRTDGSTKLGKNNKYDYFPSAGIAYKIVEDKEGMLNSLKIRGSYGVTGNQEFASNSALDKAAFGLNGTASIITNANADLKWETTKSYGVGLDFELVHNKLSGSVDYYNRDTKDLIFPVPAASTQEGPPAPRYVNLPGNLLNSGYEFSLNYNIINNENFSWNFSGNVALLKSKITNFAGFIASGALNGQGLTNAYAQVLTNDQPIYSYYMYEWRGYAADGSSIYADAAGNDSDLGLAAKKLVGKQALPKTNVGFSTSVTYKSFDLGVSFYGAFGHYLYNNTSNAYFFKGAYLGGRNVPLAVATSNQAQGDPNSPSTKYLEKGDFLRMGNLTLGFNFKSSLLEKINVKSARFYVNGQNLLVFTKYSGFDPEVSTDKTLNGVPSASIDYLSYPRSKAYSLGLNLTF